MTRHNFKMSAEGIHRALNAMDLAETARRRLRAQRTPNPDLRAAAKAGARRTIEGLRDLRQIIGADGYKLP